MKFEIPTCIYHEENAVSRHREVFSSMGKKALIVTGARSSRQNGSLKDVTGALEEAGVSYAVFSEIEENPSIETVERAAAFGKKEQAVFVIGIGGGSPLDASKAIALLMQNPDKDGSIFYQPLPLSALPVIAVPTTCGTGSEATPYAILTSHEKKTKKSISYRIFPSYAFLDPRYLMHAPLSVLRNTAVDALSHCVESHINANATVYSRMFSEKGLTLWAAAAAALRSGKFEKKDYDALMTASTMAGMAISHTGTSLPHAMSYYLTYEKGIPHGVAVGTFLAAYLDSCPDKDATGRLLSFLGLSSAEGFSLLLKELIPPVAMDAEEISRCVRNLLHDKQKLANCPFSIDAQLAGNMYRLSVSASAAI